jgi:hypothetical protein
MIRMPSDRELMAAVVVLLLAGAAAGSLLTVAVIVWLLPRSISPTWGASIWPPAVFVSRIAHRQL